MESSEESVHFIPISFPSTPPIFYQMIEWRAKGYHCLSKIPQADTVRVRNMTSQSPMLGPCAMMKTPTRRGL